MTKVKKEKLAAAEILHLSVKALKVSLKTKNKLSLAVNLIGFAMAFLPVLISTTLADLTDTIHALYGKGWFQAGRAISILLLLFALYAIKVVYTFLRNYCTAVDSVNTTKYIKSTIMKCCCNVEYKYIENYDNFNEKIAFANEFGGARVSESMQLVILWLQDLVTFITIVIKIIPVNIWLVIVLLVACIPAVILATLQKDEEYREKTKWMEEGSFVIHYFFVGVGDHFKKLTLMESRFFQLYPYIKKLWQSTADTYLYKKNKMTAKHVIYNSIADILRSSVYIFILLIIAHKIFAHASVGIGVFILVYSLAGQLQEVTTRLFAGATRFQSDALYIRDFFALEDLEREPVVADAVGLAKADIQFDHVDFSYPNTNIPALHDLNVRIKPGEKVAIVGENGSGKSTFINLLCGFYSPSNGHATINGKDITKNLSSVRKSISVVFQEFGHYETTLRNNIIISDKKRQASDEEIIELLKSTNAYSVLEEQKAGLDEIIGTFNQESNNLSGGQWQKITLARAVYRDSAKIMVLDEPTAALDPVAEAQLYRDFAKITGDKTTILISHRLGITTIVDRILVFDQGRIIEDGDHLSLMKLNGKYAEMFNAQAKWYKEVVC